MNTLTWPAIAAAWGILLAGAAGVMKTVDAARSWAETHTSFGEKLPPYTWIALAFGVGIATCVTSHLNPLTTLFPTLAHTYGEVLSGIALGAIASPLHHGTALLSAKAYSVKTDTSAAANQDDPALDGPVLPDGVVPDADA